MSELIQTSALLLERVSSTVKQIEYQYRKTGMLYNIFKVAGISRKEVPVCRILADLLNTKGLHCQGTAYLQLFMDIVVKPISENAGMLNLSKTNVTTEYSIDNGRRIDIVLDDGVIYIPIEVKIDAGEQEGQLADYAAFSRQKNADGKFVPVLFLTPLWYETKEASRNDFAHIYWEKHIISWLVKCLSLEEPDKTSPVREMLKQFIKTIKSFCGYMEDEVMEKAIESLVVESEDTVKAAYAIKQALEALDGRSYDLFRSKVLEQLNKLIPNTSWNDDHIQIPIKNGNYTLAIRYDWWYMEVWINETNKNSNTKEINALYNKMFELTGKKGEKWNDSTVWGSEEFLYPHFSDTDEDLYSYKLYKQYMENTTEVVNTIMNIVNELNNIKH
jgi:hypothetical protein